MATIGQKGDDRRHGAVRKRKQVFNPSIGRFVKIDEETGRFMDVKADDKPFAGVRGAGAKKKAKKKSKKKATRKKTGKKKSGKKKATRKKAARRTATKRTAKKRSTRKKAASRR